MLVASFVHVLHANMQTQQLERKGSKLRRKHSSSVGPVLSASSTP